MAISERGHASDRNFKVTFETSLGSLLISDEESGNTLVALMQTKEGVIVIPYDQPMMTVHGGQSALLFPKRSKKSR